MSETTTLDDAMFQALHDAGWYGRGDTSPEHIDGIKADLAAAVREWLTGQRDEIAAACLDGLVSTDHGYRYRPATGADTVLDLLTRKADQ